MHHTIVLGPRGERVGLLAATFTNDLSAENIAVLGSQRDPLTVEIERRKNLHQAHDSFDHSRLD